MPPSAKVVIRIPAYRSLTAAEIEFHFQNTGKRFKWILLETFERYSERYKRWIRCDKGMLSDGATGAFDIVSAAWWLHDQVCNTGKWKDGTRLTNWQASQVLQDELRAEGRYSRSKYWFWSTFFVGGGKARDNGMVKLRA